MSMVTESAVSLPPPSRDIYRSTADAAARDDYRMASHPPITKFQNAALVARVRQVLKETGLTPRRWSMEATGKPDTVRNILRGGSQAPRIDTMRKLASIVENCPVEWLIGETDLRNLEAAAHAQPLPAGEMPLLGYIGAGEQVYHFG